jgi:hypothetical protein
VKLKESYKGKFLIKNKNREIFLHAMGHRYTSQIKKCFLPDYFLHYIQILRNSSGLLGTLQSRKTLFIKIVVFTGNYETSAK